jgi:LCP family protein required for cell wall assembly
VKKENRNNRVFAILGILAIVTVFVAIFVFTQSVGATKKTGEDTRETIVSENNKSRYTYLVLGKDRASGLSDVMILFSLDTESKSISLLQIPRDTYARYTDKSYKKLNGALSSLGACGLCDFLSDSLGVEIDGYFVFDLDTFAKAVDLIGGVEIDIPEGMYYKDEVQGLDVSLKSGKQTLNGEAAEKFVRYRSGYLRGDLGRIDAQKLFISAFIKKVKDTLTPTKAIKLAASLMGEIKTNVKLSEIATLAGSLFEVKDEDIMLVTLAGNDVMAGASYYVISKSSAASIMREMFYAQRAFDEKGVFRNPDNEKFENIYFSSVPYKAKSSEDIAQNGIEIDKR